MSTMFHNRFKSSNGLCSGHVTCLDGRQVTVTGVCKVPTPSIKFIAAAPVDRRQSYMGSGLPWPNEEVAFGNTPNKGAVPVINGEFSFSLWLPGSYYINNGQSLVPPSLYLSGDNQVFTIPLGIKPIANRSLSSLPCRTNRSAGCWPSTPRIGIETLTGIMRE